MSQTRLTYTMCPVLLEFLTSLKQKIGKKNVQVQKIEQTSKVYVLLVAKDKYKPLHNETFSSLTLHYNFTRVSQYNVYKMQVQGLKWAGTIRSSVLATFIISNRQTSFE